jgi:universal stress protein E
VSISSRFSTQQRAARGFFNSLLEWVRMFKNILVLVGNDDPNQPTVRRALRCADDDASIEVFEAVYVPALEGYLGRREIYEPLRKRLVEERRERAASLARAIEGWGVRSCASVVWDHPLHAAVAKEVASRGIDLVVTAPLDGHVGGLAHRDWQLVMTCPAPVLIVKTDGETPYRTIVAAVDPFHAHAKPAALDADILRLAKIVRASTGARLTALHCGTPPAYFGAHPGGPPPEEPSPLESRRETLYALVDEAGVERTAARLVEGAPPEVLQAMAAGGEADLIVMGALARGRLREAVIGHTAERVLHRATADVLIVKPRAV